MIIHGPVDAEEAKMDAMRQALSKYSATLLAGDFDAWGELHTEDVIKMWPDAPATRSRAEMLTIFAKMMEGRKFAAFEIRIMKSEVHGDLGLSWGLYSWETRSEAGDNPLSYDGKFLTLFKKQPDGRWLVSYDCFNSNVSPTASEQ